MTNNDQSVDEEADEEADDEVVEDDFESDGESTASTNAHGGAPITSVWKRMAANIATAHLDDASNVQLVIDGMRTEEARLAKGDSPIKVRGDAPDWKALARATLQRATNPMSDDAFEQAWSASTVRAQGCEVLIQLSRESNAQEHGSSAATKSSAASTGPSAGEQRCRSTSWPRTPCSPSRTTSSSSCSPGTWTASCSGTAASGSTRRAGAVAPSRARS